MTMSSAGGSTLTPNQMARGGWSRSARLELDLRRGRRDSLLGPMVGSTRSAWICSGKLSPAVWPCDAELGAHLFYLVSDEDTRRYDSYPPHDGSSAHSGYPGLGMGLWNRSSSFVGGLVNSRRDVSGGSGIGFEGGDLGARSGYDHADDEGTGLLHAGEVDSHGADSPQTDENPFAEMHSAATPASSSSHPCDLPRSPGIVPFYPGTNYPITSSSYLPYSAPSSTDHSHSSDDPSSQFHTSSEETSYLPSPVSASAHRPTYPLAVSRSSAAIAGGQQGISRSESSLGWRRVLGLGRPKSPSALTTPTASVLWQLRDPAPPPELEFVRDSTQELGGMPSSKWHQARLQERSLSSITSARACLICLVLCHEA